jgi:hypothetical protein
MTASLLDAPVMQYTNKITVFNRTNAVTNHHDRSLVSQLKKCLPQ